MNKTSRTLLVTLFVPLVLVPSAPVPAAQAIGSAAIIVAQEGNGGRPDREQRKRRKQQQRAQGEERREQEQGRERRQRVDEQGQRGREQEQRAREQRREQQQRAQGEERREQEQRRERRQRAEEQEQRGREQEQRAQEQRREQQQRAQGEERREQEQRLERRQRAEEEHGRRLRDRLRETHKVEERILERRQRWLDQASRPRRGDFVRREGDRVIIREDDRLIIRHDDSDRFRWRARDYNVHRRDDGWTETVVIREGDVRVVTVIDEYGRIVRRYREHPDRQRVVLFDNRPSWWRDDPRYYVVDVPPPVVAIPYEQYVVAPSAVPPAQVYQALTAPPVQELEQGYTLDQVLWNESLRAYMPRVDLDTITFAFGSAEIRDDQIDLLEEIGVAMERAIAEDPNEVFLIEGHTDAVGSDLDNLALSDRRAEAIAVILTDYFEIPPENLVTQGYGEQYLKVNTQAPERENRRVALRRITPLLVSEDAAK